MMKGLSLILLGGVSAFWFAQSSALTAHVKTLADAPSLTATLNVQPIGGAPATWKLSYSKPNLLKLERPDGFTLTDGKVLYRYSKADNSWTENPVSDADLLKTAAGQEVWAWQAFFNKDAAKAVLSAKPGANRVVKGVQVAEIALSLEGGAAATLLFDPKLGIARGFTYKQGEADLLVTSTDITLGKEALGAEVFAFAPPAGAKKQEAAPADAGATYAQVQALFNQTCMPCHSSARRSGGHNLSTYAGIARAITPGNPDSSPLVHSISGPTPRMPQQRPPLTSAQVEMVRQWIQAGAKQS